MSKYITETMCPLFKPPAVSYQMYWYCLKWPVPGVPCWRILWQSSGLFCHNVISQVNCGVVVCSFVGSLGKPGCHIIAGKPWKWRPKIGCSSWNLYARFTNMSSEGNKSPHKAYKGLWGPLYSKFSLLAYRMHLLAMLFCHKRIWGIVRALLVLLTSCRK